MSSAAVETCFPPTSSTITSAQGNLSFCRYFARGICRFGDMCRFSHDIRNLESTSASISSSSTTSSCASSATASTSTSEPNKKNTLDRKSWANAPVFIPKLYKPQNQNADAAENQNGKQVAEDENSKTWAQIARGSGYIPPVPPTDAASTLCPYAILCPYGECCEYLHGELCDMCGLYTLHPTNKDERKKHINECIKQHEKAMELSFAIARSTDKTCGICFDTIMEKNGREKRFGILPNCNHIFCLECIRKWRQAKQFENKIVRSCPECRVSSDFVCPSAFWVDTKEDKDKLLNEYKAALTAKDCKYFKKGEGKCPFGNKCFYKHAGADGVLIDVGCPRPARKIHVSDELIDLLDFYLWDFVDQRDVGWWDVLSSDSEESNWSDSEYVY